VVFVPVDGAFDGVAALVGRRVEDRRSPAAAAAAPPAPDLALGHRDGGPDAAAAQVGP
jgi:hypothetical protein